MTPFATIVRILINPKCEEFEYVNSSRYKYIYDFRHVKPGIYFDKHRNLFVDVSEYIEIRSADRKKSDYFPSKYDNLNPADLPEITLEIITFKGEYEVDCWGDTTIKDPFGIRQKTAEQNGYHDEVDYNYEYHFRKGRLTRDTFGNNRNFILCRHTEIVTEIRKNRGK